MAETNEASGELAPATAEPVRVSAMPQFSTAEYAHLPETETCALCSQRLGESYYRAEEKKLCNGCAERIFEAYPRDSHARFMRALLLGVGAAIVGLAVYATFTIVTHIYLGYLALGVGWFIAKAMLKGSGGVGGRRYQITAVLLTYFSIAMAELPIVIYSIMHEGKAQVHSGPVMHPIKAIAFLLFYGIASPFLQLQNVAQGLLGLFILFIGLRIAWTRTQARGPVLEGPFPVV